MNFKRLSIRFQETNTHLGSIVGVGLALGIANYALRASPSLGLSLAQQVSISLFIGYLDLLINYNQETWLGAQMPDWPRRLWLGLLFSLVGLLGSEVLQVVTLVLFDKGKYGFATGGGLYLFNMILSCILGFGFGYWIREAKKLEKNALLPEENQNLESLVAIPIKKGEDIFLYKPAEVIYFEAYDNYSYLYDLEGQKHLCDYSLKVLEARLGNNFLRVHRSYLINREHILQITPFVKGRFVIKFKDEGQSSITSSRSYAEEIKALIKI